MDGPLQKELSNRLILQQSLRSDVPTMRVKNRRTVCHSGHPPRIATAHAVKSGPQASEHWD